MALLQNQGCWLIREFESRWNGKRITSEFLRLEARTLQLAPPTPAARHRSCSSSGRSDSIGYSNSVEGELVEDADAVLEGAAGNRDVAFDLGEAEAGVEIPAGIISATGEVVESLDLIEVASRAEPVKSILGDGPIKIPIRKEVVCKIQGGALNVF